MEAANANGNLSASFMKHVGEYVLVQTPLARADVCIVFGNIKHPDHLAEHAAELYHQGYFGRVLVSGAPITDNGVSEAHRMRDILIAKGVPAKDIIVENQARDTPENVKYSMEMLEREIGLKNIKSVLSIGHIHASRRFIMTLERRWPEVIKMFSTDNCFKVSRENWHADPEFKRMVLEEYERIADHKARGIIQEVDLDKTGKAISSLPKPFKNAA